MRSAIPSILLLLLPLTNALHFYLDANEQKCFMEELPIDTIVEGQTALPSLPLSLASSLKLTSVSLAQTGHYTALEWSEMNEDFKANNDVGVQVTVTVRLQLVPLLPASRELSSASGSC